MIMHSEYRTPRRRHSSLFQRMEEEIQKISRKLSAAKSTVRPSSYEKGRLLKGSNRKDQKQNKHEGKQRAKQNLFDTTNFKSLRKNIHFDEFPETSVIETVRIKRMPQDKEKAYNSPASGHKTVGSKTLNKRMNFASFRQNQEERILKLEQENEELAIQLKKMEVVCADQSYRLGYASAYFDDKCKKLEQEKDVYQRQNIYLQKLCDHYKSKAKKYKESLNKYSNSNRHISELSNNSYS